MRYDTTAMAVGRRHRILVRHRPRAALLQTPFHSDIEWARSHMNVFLADQRPWSRKWRLQRAFIQRKIRWRTGDGITATPQRRTKVKHCNITTPFTIARTLYYSGLFSNQYWTDTSLFLAYRGAGNAARVEIS